MSGYVRLYRSLLGHPAFRHDGEAMAFAWMIAQASWAPVCVRYKEQKVELGRGQLAVSIRDFATRMERSKGWVERFLTRLKKERMIETKIGTVTGTPAATGVTVITICNYDKYQGPSNDGETGTETPTGTQPGHRTRKGKNIKNKEDSPNGESNRGFSAPQPEWSEFAAFRKRIRKPLTEHAVKLNLAKLEKLAEEGHDPRAVLNQSIMNGWTGLHPLKENRRNGRPDEHPLGKTGAAASAVLDELERADRRRSEEAADAGDSRPAIGSSGGSRVRALPRPS